jgi:TolA-binding protein
MSAKQITLACVGVFLILGFGYAATGDLVKRKDQVKFQQIQLKSESTKLKELDIKYDQLNKDLEKASDQKEQNAEELNKLKQQKEDLEKQKQDLEAQLQAKIETKTKLAQASERAINAATFTGTASAASAGGPRSGCGDNQYAAFIYGQESGGRVTGNCNTTARNAGGCYGIGQDCNGVLYTKCGADYACQNAFFNDYAARRYGGWAGAYNFWKANGWW